MRFYRAKERENARLLMREAYVMRGIQLITEYTAGFVGGKQGLADWQDVINDKHDTRSGDEIAADIFKRAGLRRESDESV